MSAALEPQSEQLPDLTEVGRSQGVGQTLNELWQNRELLYFLVWKDIKVKYKQASLGIAWAVLQPLLGMLLFTLLFGRVAKLPNDGMPYPLFYFTSMLSWTFFSTALLTASNSVISNTSLVSKVYFPRILLPVSGVIASALDLAIASVILVGLIAFYQLPLTPQLLFIPFVLVLLIVFAVGAGQFFAALNVNYRDVKHALPFLVQLWFFASPVVYPISMVPERYQWLVSLNPLTGIIEASRALLMGRSVPWDALWISCAVIVVTCVLSLWYFRRTERRFADVI